MNILRNQGVLIFLSNLSICTALLIIYSINADIGRFISMIVAGLIVTLMFSTLAWLINHSTLNDFEKRNTHFIFHTTLGISICGLAAAFGDGSIFNTHEVRNKELFVLVFGGFIFGGFISFGILFDYALLYKSPIAKLVLGALSLGGLIMMIAWYSATEGVVFIVSIVIARIAFSILMNRKYVDRLQHTIRTVGWLALSLLVLVLPVTAFLTK